ncbi:MAG: sigma-70 family RNA polymerase sigma factor [Ruminococcus sp.]|nr:sigma-70 family RNA polymerase sigma factor [Ruminococcus sp.]
MMTKAETALLVQKAQTGDKAAFETLYNEYRGKVYFFVRRFTGSGDAAEDLTSETFTAAMEGIGELRSEESFAGWLYSIAYNKCARFLKDESRSINVNSSAELEELIEAAALNEPILLPEDYAVNAETRAQLREVIDGLSPDMRSAVIMYYYDEMSIPEVAAAMGTNENNVSQKLHRARRRIRSKIEKLIGRGTLFGAAPMSSLLETLSDSGMDMSSAGIGLAAISAAAVAVPYGLNKASGGIAGELLFITRKYWSRHKKSLAALLFSGVLLCAVMVGTFLQVRANFNRSLHSYYDQNGMFDVMLMAPTDELIADLASRKAPEVSQTINVLKDKAEVYGSSLTCGYADRDISLMHIPFESGGLPEKEGEVAITRGVADQLCWPGRTGDTIKISGRDYTVSGIISSDYDRRVFSEFNYDAVMYDDVKPYVIPSVYFARREAAQVDYGISLYGGVAEGQGESMTYFGLSWIDFIELLEEKLGPGQRIIVNDLDDIAAATAQSEEFRQNVRLFLLLAGISSVIAVLSVFSVLRLIFEERRNTYELLHRVGVSNRQLGVMYIIECLILIIGEIILGSLLGATGYAGVHSFETNALGQSDYSAFTSDRLVLGNTHSPLLIGVIVSAAVMLLGYGVTLLFSRKDMHQRRHRLPKRTVFGSMGAVLGSRLVTAVQTLSLTLIVFGTMLGYVYFSDDGKGFLNYLSYEPPQSYEINEQLDMERDSIAEYYTCTPAMVGTVGSFEYGLPLSGESFGLGLNDEEADRLGDVTAYGNMRSTFIISPQENTSGLKGLVDYSTEDYTSEEMKRQLADASDEQYRSFFEKGHIGANYLYRIDTKLANKEFIGGLSEYVSEGEIDLEAIRSGKEVIVLLTTGNDRLLPVGSTITVGSLLMNENYGIAGESTAQTKIGAVVVLDGDQALENEALYSYIAQSDFGYSLLTTQSGAEALGIYNAAYNEIFSDHHIDGGLVPTDAGLTFFSLEEMQHRRFIEKAAKLGGFLFLALVMAALGFAAYFNGIGMKVRLKEYQISVLRAIGASKAKIHRRLFINNIKIPIIATLIAGGGIYGIQKYVFKMYGKAINLVKPDELGMISWDEASDAKRNEMIDRYFINSELWTPGIVKPLIIVFSAVTLVTVILMVLNMNRFDRDIAASMSRGRKRQ